MSNRFCLDERVITAGFKDRNYYAYWGRHHYGTDYVASFVNLYAPTGGRIKIISTGITGGLRIEFLDDLGYLHRFLHLDKVLVRSGQRINAGQQIAVTGNSGSMRNSRGVIIKYRPHLHTDIEDSKGNWIDPEWYYNYIINGGLMQFNKAMNYNKAIYKFFCDLPGSKEPTVLKVSAKYATLGVRRSKRCLLRKFDDNTVKVRIGVSLGEFIESGAGFPVPMNLRDIEGLPKF